MAALAAAQESLGSGAASAGFRRAGARLHTLRPAPLAELAERLDAAMFESGP